MSILKIRIFPDPILKETAAPVETFDQPLADLLDNMYETMLHADGIGLAAPQIGESKRIAVIDVTEKREQRIELINPVITGSEGQVSSEEGCLSIPEYRDKIKRAKSVTVRARNREGEEFEISAEGLLAICLQHEIDHLNGVLFVDHLSRLKRELFRRWYKKNIGS